MKILIFAMGPGESTQAYAVAKYAKESGHDVLLVLRQDINLQFFKEGHLETILAPTPPDLVRAVSSYQPEAILLCNSKAFSNYEDFVNISPFGGTPAFTLDSNWLFNSDYDFFRFVKWPLCYFVNFSKAVFSYGLKSQGGYFDIGEDMINKIIPVGLVPSYAPISGEAKIYVRKHFGIESDEKLIFSYYSGFGAGDKSWILDKLISSVDALEEEGKKIKVIYTGHPLMKIDDGHDNFIGIGGDVPITPEAFYYILASSDLVFQHQGLGTLEQAISAMVPVIANVRENKINNGGYPRLHIGEIEPFEKAGLCKMLKEDNSVNDAIQAVKSLLYNQESITNMQQAQERNHSRGEEKLISIIVKTVQEKSIYIN